MTARSEARDDAVVVLLEAGWDQERIRQALGISQALAARLVALARPPAPPFRLRDGCCAPTAPGLYCDAPGDGAWRGVCCASHAHGAVWRRS